MITHANHGLGYYQVQLADDLYHVHIWDHTEPRIMRDDATPVTDPRLAARIVTIIDKTIYGQPAVGQQ